MLCGHGTGHPCDGERKHVPSGGGCSLGAARLPDPGQAHGRAGLRSDIFHSFSRSEIIFRFRHVPCICELISDIVLAAT